MRTATCTACGVDVEIEFSPWMPKSVLEAEAKSALCANCGRSNPEAVEAWKREQDERRQRWEGEQREREERVRAERFVGIVGRKYRDVSLETYRATTAAQRAALDAAKSFSANPSGFLYLHGTTGIGKTHLAVGIYREQTRESAHGVEFWRVPELLLHLRSQIGRDVSEEEAIDPLLRARVLILDDLGAEKITDWVRQAFYVVVSRRELDELPTVFTSNLSLGEIEARIGDERITSRIAGAARIVRVDGQDQRVATRARR